MWALPATLVYTANYNRSESSNSLFETLINPFARGFSYLQDKPSLDDPGTGSFVINKIELFGQTMLKFRSSRMKIMKIKDSVFSTAFILYNNYSN